jgi:hypothetical protein
MAAGDAARGWREGGQSILAEQRRRRSAAVNINSSGAGSTPGSGKRTALVAVPTANVWPKTQLLLHSLAAISDSFQLLVCTDFGTFDAPHGVFRHISSHCVSTSSHGSG